MNYQTLTNREEDIMRALWKLKKAFVKEIKEELNQGLSYNTVSTITRNLEDKKYVGHHVFGNTHQYFPLVSQEKYQLKVLNLTADNFFKGSYKNLVSFFAANEKISRQDLEDIINTINKK